MGKKNTNKKDVNEISADLLAAMEGDSGHGMEGADNSCYAISYLTILQALSPQVQKKGSEYIKGAEVGMIFNTATGEVFDGDDGIEIVQVGFERIINIWKPLRGGFAGKMAVNDERFINARHGATGTQDEHKLFDAEGNILSDTHNHFVFIIKKDGGLDPVVLSCSSSKIAMSKKFMSKLRGLRLKSKNGVDTFNPPTYAFSYRLTTFLDSNQRGDEYYNWNMPVLEGAISDPHMYDESKTANLQIAEGTMQAALPAAPAQETLSSGGM